MIEFVFVDLDDTLLNFTKSERRCIAATMKRLGVEPTDELCDRYAQINDEVWKSIEEGKLDRDAARRLRFEIFFAEQGITVNGDEINKFYTEILAEKCYYIHGAREFLRRVSSHYRVYLVTNGTASVQRKRLKRSEFGDFFEMIFISEELGYYKPDPHFFESCFEKIVGFDRSKAVIVGDSYRSDIVGGMSVGIKTIHFDRKSKRSAKKQKYNGEANVTVRSLAAAKKIIDEM